MLKYEKIIRKMSLLEKVSLTSGKDYWRTKALVRLRIPKITLSDGPHGLRHQGEDQDHMGINQSNPSTCFPPACLTAASFDPSLLFKMGQAIGYEALSENVQVVLGPGVNLKRNPLCGRNFEYFSEDPVLAGNLSAGWIKGVKSMGVGVSLKHFALNNQEKKRMMSNSVVDEKTMFDLYLKAFEIPLKEAKPDTVMCSYNLVNGTYASENKWLLTSVLREEFGYSGLVVTDWGAMNDKRKALKAGLDLEMPGSQGYFDAMTLRALTAGTLEEKSLDQSVDRILELIYKTSTQQDEMVQRHGPFQMTKEMVENHHELARHIATESAVLLQNKNRILPLEKPSRQKIHVVGELAQTPRYQGAGSSHINAYKVTSLKEILEKEQIKFNFIPGYSLQSQHQEQMDGKALLAISEDDVVVLALGLPESFEAEGFDRKHMRLPENQNHLVKKLLDRTKNIIVLMYGGAPVEMPWADQVAAILNLYLPGEAGGEAAYDLIFGEVNPSGKLPETYPISYSDHVTSEIYGKQTDQVEYREGLYVGYRYFDRAHKPVRFPFGHGLSYTDFSYRDLVLEEQVIDFREKETYTIRFLLKNNGDQVGKEVSQLYLKIKNQKGYGVVKKLLAFQKTLLQPGEEKEITFKVRENDFVEYDPVKKRKIVLEGDYELLVGTSSAMLPLSRQITLKGETMSSKVYADFYTNLIGKPTREDFITLLGHALEKPKKRKVFTSNDSLSDMKDQAQMKPILAQLEKILKSSTGTGVDDEDGFQTVYAMLMETPIKRLSLVSPEKMPGFLGETIVHVANGKYAKATKELFFGGIRTFKP